MATHTASFSRIKTLHLFLGGICLPAFMAFGADFTVVNNGLSSYTINSLSNPTLTLQRGTTYTFAVNASGHPFYIKTIQGNTTANAYNNGVTGNGVQVGTLTFSVPTDAPDTLYYNCQFHAAMTGVIQLVNPPTPPAPVILNLSVGTNVVVKFTGSNTFSYFPEFNTNLAQTNWFSLSVQTNVTANGTNDVYCGKPPADNVFIRIRAQ